MNFVLQRWQLLVVILTGWLNRQQQAVIDFLLTEVLAALSSVITAFQQEACKSPTGSLKRKTLIAVDELAAAGPVLGLANALHICRELGFCIVVAVQSEAQLRSVYGEAAGTVLAGFQTQSAMPGLDPESAEYFSMKSGTTTVAVPAVMEQADQEDGGVATA